MNKKRLAVIHILVTISIGFLFLFTSNTRISILFRAFLGYADSQATTGDLFFKNNDLEKAEYWYRKSTDGGSSKGYVRYSFIISDKNPNQAADILKKGADDECLRCAYLMVFGYATREIYSLGIKIENNPEEAYRIAKKYENFKPDNSEDFENLINTLYWCGYSTYSEERRSRDFNKSKYCFDKIVSSKWSYEIPEWILNNTQDYIANINLQGKNMTQEEITSGANYFIKSAENFQNKLLLKHDNIVEAIKIFFNGKGVKKNREKAKELAKSFEFRDVLNFLTEKDHELYRCVNNHAFEYNQEVVEVKKEGDSISITSKNSKSKNNIEKQPITLESWNKIKDTINKTDLFSHYNHETTMCLSEGAYLGIYAMKEGELQILNYSCQTKPETEPVCKEIFKLAGLELKFH